MTRILTIFKNDENLCLLKRWQKHLTSDILLHLKPEKLDEHPCLKFDMCLPPHQILRLLELEHLAVLSLMLNW